MVSSSSSDRIENMCNRVPNTSGCEKKRRNESCPALHGHGCTSRYQFRPPQQQQY